MTFTACKTIALRHSITRKNVESPPKIVDSVSFLAFSETAFFTTHGRFALGSCVLPLFCGWDSINARPILSMSHIFRAEDHPRFKEVLAAHRPASVIIDDILTAYAALQVPHLNVHCLALIGGMSNEKASVFSQWEKNITITKQELLRVRKAPKHEFTRDMYTMVVDYQWPRISLVCTNHRLKSADKIQFDVRALFALK